MPKRSRISGDSDSDRCAVARRLNTLQRGGPSKSAPRRPVSIPDLATRSNKSLAQTFARILSFRYGRLTAAPDRVFNSTSVTAKAMAVTATSVASHLKQLTSSTHSPFAIQTHCDRLEYRAKMSLAKSKAARSRVPPMVNGASMTHPTQYILALLTHMYLNNRISRRGVAVGIPGGTERAAPTAGARGERGDMGARDKTGVRGRAGARTPGIGVRFGCRRPSPPLSLLSPRHASGIRWDEAG